MGGNHHLQGCFPHQSDDIFLWLPVSSLSFLLSPFRVPHDLMLLLAAYNPIIRVLIVGKRDLPKGIPYL